MIKVLGLLALAASLHPMMAEETPTESMFEESSETSSLVTSETTSEITPVEEDQESKFEEFKKEVLEWGQQYVQKDTMMQIINWAVDTGVLGALFMVYLKYRKYKNKTLEELVDGIKKQLKDQLGESFDKMSDSQKTNMINAIEGLKKSNELLMKALVLSQGKTSKDKIAMLDMLAQANTTVEVKETIVEVKKEIEETEAVKEEIKAAVKSDYTPID